MSNTEKSPNQANHY